MDSPLLQTICNFIILLGAVAGAITGILALCGRPIRFFKKRKEQAEAQRKKEEDARTTALIQEISKTVKANLAPDFDDLYQQNEEQSASITAQGKQIDKLSHSIRDTIGAEITAFYEQYKTKRIITEAQKETIEDLYKQYKTLKGNHHVDNMYKRMHSWDIYTEDGVKVDKDRVTWWEPPETPVEH